MICVEEESLFVPSPAFVALLNPPTVTSFNLAPEIYPAVPPTYNCTGKNSFETFMVVLILLTEYPPFVSPAITSFAFSLSP